MKDLKLGKYLIPFSVAKGNTLSDKYFTEYSQNLKVGEVYTKRYFSFEKRHHLKNDNIVYWLVVWCFLIGVAKLKVNKEGL